MELTWKEKKTSIDLLKMGVKADFTELKSKIVNAKAQFIHSLFEGDNLQVMLLNRERWKNNFQVIYIDPPYNTGTKSFLYNDKFKEADTLDSHSDWLSFIYPRLILAQEFLAENGAIFISIDDAELYHLKVICDEIFGSQNFVANLVRKNKTGAGHDSKQIAVEYDYVLCYAKNLKNLKFSKDSANVEFDKKYRLTDEFENRRGKYYLRDLDYRGNYSQSLDYALKMPDGTEIFAGGKFGKPNTWRWSKDKVEWGLANGFVVFKKQNQTWKAYIKQYQYVDNKDKIRVRKIPYRALIDFSNSKGSLELKQVLNQNIFHYPKPLGLIEFILKLYDFEENLNILDFFAGSGTTLHAAMRLNQGDGKNRLVTLITNNENNICELVTYQRNKKAIEGFTDLKGKQHQGLNKNGLRYFKLT